MAEQKQQQLTEYNVFRGNGDSDGWTQVGSQTARDATQAIRQHLAGEFEVDGVFVATPARSWKPVPVKTRVALDFGEVS